MNASSIHQSAWGLGLMTWLLFLGCMSMSWVERNLKRERDQLNLSEPLADDEGIVFGSLVCADLPIPLTQLGDRARHRAPRRTFPQQRRAVSPGPAEARE